MRASITANLFNQRHGGEGWDFYRLVNDRLNSGRWTEHELALTIKNEWLSGADARYEDVLRDVRSARLHWLGHHQN